MADDALPSPSLAGTPHPDVPAVVDRDGTSLPLDLLLEIVVRSSTTSIVRCAATSKPLRRAILSQGFRRLLSVRSAANASGGFDPALLCGVSFKVEDSINIACPVAPVRVVDPPLPPAHPLHPVLDDATLLRFEPLACRGCLLVIRPRHDGIVEQGGAPPAGELRMCNTITGDISILPPPVDSNRDYYSTFALLAVSDDDGRSFELLVAEETLRYQTYSSRDGDGKWSGGIRRARLGRSSIPFYGSSPLVTGRTVHWLGYPTKQTPVVVALHVDTAEAAVIELPQGCTGRMAASWRSRALMLATSVADGRLAVLMSETQKISMWTLESSSAVARWSRRVLVDKQQWGGVHNPVRFEGFGERSGAVLMQIERVGLVRLDLATMEVSVVRPWGETDHVSQVCLHETSLPYLLRSMKVLI